MREPLRYWCSGCNRELGESQVEHYHSLGIMCKLCRSGKVRVIPPGQEVKP